MILSKESHQTSMVNESVTGIGSLETQTVGKGTTKLEFDKTKLCDKCGCYTHPTKKCMTPKHLAILYQQSQGGKVPQGKRFEANLIRGCPIFSVSNGGGYGTHDEHNGDT
jgi:hypothetical protein